jgi:DNA-directed RNA polymerase specialized sigma24 family protein
VGRAVRSDDAPEAVRRDTFAVFVSSHERRLRQALTAALGAEAGREAAAESLAYGWEHWDRVSGMQNPVGYLYVVGRNGYRRRHREVRRGVSFPVSAGGQDPWCEPALAKLLESLPDRERVVVLLLHGYEWSMSEAADLLGVSKSTVQTHADRGMARLRTGLGVTL